MAFINQIHTIKLPEFFWSEPDLRGYFKEQNTIIEQLTNQAGSSDAVDSLDTRVSTLETSSTDYGTRITQNETNIATNLSSINDLEDQDAEAMIASLTGRIGILEALVECLIRETTTDRSSEIFARLSAIEAQL